MRPSAQAFSWIQAFLWRGPFLVTGQLRPNTCNGCCGQKPIAHSSKISATFRESSNHGPAIRLLLQAGSAKLPRAATIPEVAQLSSTLSLLHVCTSSASRVGPPAEISSCSSPMVKTTRSHVDLKDVVDICQRTNTAIYAFRTEPSENSSSGPRNLARYDVARLADACSISMTRKPEYTRT